MCCRNTVVVSGRLHTELGMRIDSFSNPTRDIDIGLKYLRQSVIPQINLSSSWP